MDVLDEGGDGAGGLTEALDQLQARLVLGGDEHGLKFSFSLPVFTCQK